MLLAVAPSRAAVDPTFDPEIDGPVTHLVKQPDGKLLVAGRFQTINGFSRPRLARLQPNGSVDPTFSAAIGGYVDVLALAPDGRVLVYGDFLEIGGVARTYFARLHADGTLDASFDAQGVLVASWGGPELLSALAVQADGKVLVGGGFSRVNGTAQSGLARFNADGSLDAAFNAGGGVGGEVHSIVLEPDGDLMVGGSSRTYRGLNVWNLMRVHSDGSPDPSFVSPVQYGQIRDVWPLADGRFLIGGQFGLPSSSTNQGLNAARLQSNGELDPTFNPGNQLQTGVTMELGPVQPDGKVYAYGYLQGVFRLRPDGTRDPGFEDGLGERSYVQAAVLQDDGGLVIGGAYSLLDNTTPPILTRYRPDNAPPAASSIELVATGVSVEEGQPFATLRVRRLLADQQPASVRFQLHGLTAAAGADFSAVSGTLSWPARDVTERTIQVPLLDDGEVEADETFMVELLAPTGAALTSRSSAGVTIRDNEQPPTLLDTSFGGGGFGVTSLGIPAVSAVLVQPDDKLLLLGTFNSVNGIARSTLARLNADGTTDESFQPPTVPVAGAVLQPDGKIVIAGEFSSIGGIPRANLARLHPDGSLDLSFYASSAPTRHAIIRVQADGKILVGGSDGAWNQQPGFLRRYHANGTSDTSFHPPALGDPDTLREILVQPDGKMVLVGDLTAFPGGVGRLSPDGSTDLSFQPPSMLIYRWTAAALQPDGKILLASLSPLVVSASLTRLNPDGTLDSTFRAETFLGQAYAASIHSLVLEPDGGIIAAGGFDFVGGVARIGIVRLHPNGSTDLGFDPGSSTGTGSELIYSVGRQSDGRWVLGGNFSTFAGQPYGGVARLQPPVNAIEFTSADYRAGESDSALVIIRRRGPTTAPVSVELAIANGTAQFGRDYIAQGGTVRFAPLEVQKTLEIEFKDDRWLEADETIQLRLLGGSLGAPSTATVTILDNESAPSNQDGAFDFEPVVQARQTDGKWLVSWRSFLQRYHGDQALEGGDSDDAVDLTFGVVVLRGTTDRPGYARTVVIQPDGKILVGGPFSNVGNHSVGQPRPGLARLNTDGSLDTNFLPAISSSSGVQAIVLQPDGRILVSGNDVTSTSGRGIVRLLPDGRLDTSFSSRIQGSAGALALQADGRILVGGSIYEVNQIPRAGLARLHKDGALDATFGAQVFVGAFTAAGVSAIAVQPDGRVLIGGDFSWVSGTRRSHLARLHSDGSFDHSFEVGPGPDGPVNVLLLQTDGRVIAGGRFDGLPAARRPALVRLNPDGSPDIGFAPGLSTDSEVTTLVALPDGGLLAGGDFCAHTPPGCNPLFDEDCITCLGTIHLLPDPRLRFRSVRHHGGQAQLIIEAFPGRLCVLQCSEDLRQWTPLATNAPPESVLEFIDSGASGSPRRFYRAVEPR